MPTYLKDPTPSWLKPEQASVTDSARTKVLRWIASVIGADDPTSQVMGLMTTAVPSAGKEGGILGAAKKWIKAYHGSPHDFEKFSLEKIGTGEGAQAYGHGLYFAEAEATAKTYRDALSSGEYVLANGTPYNPKDPSHFAAATLLEYPNSDAAVADLVRDIGQLTQVKASWRDAAIKSKQDTIAAIRGGNLPKLVDKSGGKMYEVAIHADPDHMLDWDKPLSQQSEAVVQSLQKAGWTPQQLSEFTGREYYERLGHEKARAQGHTPTSLPASELSLGKWSRENQRTLTSDALKDAGIPGIKYLDQGSRAAGEGSRNYVVFDDAIVTILKKYGLLPAAATAGVYQKYQDAEQ